MSDERYQSWFENASFTTDWIAPHVANWFAVLRDRRERVADVLEIGAWEGRSAIFWLNYFPKSRVACIDTFAGSAEHHMAFPDQVSSIEARFDT